MPIFRFFNPELYSPTRIDEEIVQEKEKLEILQRNAAALVSIHDPDQLLRTIVENARKISKAIIVVVTQYDQGKNALHVKFTSGFNQPIIQRALHLMGVDPVQLYYRADEGTITKWIMDNRKPLQTSSLYDMVHRQVNRSVCEAAQRITGVNNLIAVPMYAGNNFLGSFVFFFRKDTKVDVNYLETFGAQCAQALNTANTVLQLKKHTEELEKVNRFMEGREMDIIELKQEVNRLLGELGREKKYKIVD